MTDPRSKLSYIFWGLLLTILDVEINGFDVLPDFIGYLCIFVGCSGLLIFSKQFLITKNVAFILTLLAVGSYFLSLNFSQTYGYIYLATDVAMVWFLLGGIIDVSQKEGNLTISRKASSRRIGYCVLMCLVASSSTVWHFAPNMIAYWSIALVISTLLVLFFILKLIHSLKYELLFRS